MPPRPPIRRRHWIVRVATWLVLIVIILLGALYFTGEQIAQSILRDKLQTLISQQLNARLEIGALSYHFPYGVSVSDVALVTRGPDGGDLTLMSFKTLRLTVAKFPLGKEPLVIERIDIDRPTVHLIRTAAGYIGETSLVRSGDEKKQRKSPPLSDVLQLRHLAFTSARVEYDDRTQPGSHPLIWDNLDANLDSQPKSKSEHSFSFAADNADLAKIDSAGTIDLDSLVLKLEKMKITTAVHAKQANKALPAEVQRVLQASGIGGDATINVHGTLPLLSIKDIDAVGDVHIDNGHGIVPGLSDPLADLTLVAGGDYQHGKVHAQVDQFKCRSGSIGVSLQPMAGTFDRTSGRWLADPVKAAIIYEPVDSASAFWRQKISIVLRAGVHQLENKNNIEAVLDGTTITPQGLAGDLNLIGSVVYSDGGIVVRPTTVTGLGGTFGITGIANFRTPAYDAKVTMQNVDLAKINVVLDPLASKEMNGQVNGQVRATIIGKDVNNLTGDGGFRVTDGKFARVPVLSQITDFLQIGRGAFVANDAFGHFKIDGQKLTFDRMAMSTSVLRIRGQGVIGFDNALNLKVYADSASNWGNTVRKTNVPILSSLVGAVAGGTQAVIGSVSKQFTSMTVTGTIDKPKIFPAPAPMLTENLEKLFRSVE